MGMTQGVIAQDSDFTSIVSGPLAVQVWHGETTSLGLDALERAHDLVDQANPRIAFLVLVDPEARPPSAEARARIADLMRCSTKTVASALVFGGLGFKASIIRGVVTGLNLLAGYPFPYRTFADADTAVGWLRTMIPLARDLEETLHRFERSSLAPPARR